MAVCAVDRGNLYPVRNLFAGRGFDVYFPFSSRLAHECQLARLIAVHDERIRIVHHMDRRGRARTQILNQVGFTRVEGDRNLACGIRFSGGACRAERKHQKAKPPQ
jgi:hypothetical protein